MGSTSTERYQSHSIKLLAFYARHVGLGLVPGIIQRSVVLKSSKPCWRNINLSLDVDLIIEYE